MFQDDDNDDDDDEEIPLDMEEVEAEVPQRGSSEEAFQANFKTLVP